MQVMDIVNRAAMMCGVASSFNPDEVPEDIQARGADILRHEIVPTLNCDRSVDITEIVYPATPKDGIIDLRTTPLEYENIIVGCVPYTYDYLRYKEQTMVDGEQVIYYPHIRTLLNELGYARPFTPGTLGEITDKWPRTQFESEIIPIVCWTSDNKLVNLTIPKSNTMDKDDELLDKRYNVPFAPMRVTSIVRASDGAPMQYLHAEEMISAEFRFAQLVYTVEDHPDLMRIRFNPSYANEPVLLVLPIPVKIVNSYEEPNPWQGVIVAPEKFRMFLTATLAARLAGEYGLQTQGDMEKLAEKAYLSLIKNLSRQHHAQDIPRRIHNYLERGRGWRAGANGSGYAGGFNG